MSVPSPAPLGHRGHLAFLDVVGRGPLCSLSTELCSGKEPARCVPSLGLHIASGLHVVCLISLVRDGEESCLRMDQTQSLIHT